MDFTLQTHRAHDAGALIAAWRRAAREAGWRVEELLRVEGFPVLVLRSRGQDGPGLYLSSGIHGDEAAAPWGMLAWFQKNAVRLRDRRVVIFPLLNPCGLVANTRTNEQGIDLNRLFHDEGSPLTREWVRCLAGEQFDLALCTHEDYDAQGIYVYEVYHLGRPALADGLLGRCARIIPRDVRKKIDGRAAKNGVIRRNRLPKDLPGHPEAIALHLHYTRHSLTFETPSEFCLADRIRAHEAFVGVCADAVFGKK